MAESQQAKTKIQKNDFIELEFTGKIADTDEIFDTTIKEDAEKINVKPENIKPHILSVGRDMIIKGLDKSLEGKEIGKQYTEQFKPEQAFGKRNPQLVRMVPLKAFTEQKIQPQRGMQLSLDNQLVRIASVSGGRVLVDFNNPLAGKTIEYKFKINRKITDQKEKVNALQDFFFKTKFEFNINREKKTIAFKIPKKQEQLQKFIELMAKPFKDILGFDVKGEVESEKPSTPQKQKTDEKKNE